MAENIHNLKIRRKQIKAAKTRFQTYVQAFDPAEQNISQLKLRRDKFEDLYSQFESTQSSIEILDETEVETNERSTFENSYFEILDLSNAKTAEQDFNQVDRVSNTSQESSTCSRVRLPKIELPKFNGIYEEWYNFRDTFNSLIHTNSTISSIEKFNYLKSALSGEAAEITHSLEISEENYQAAWDMLNERFDSKRLIIQKHIHAIHNLPICNKESYNGIRVLLDGINKHVRALSSLKCPTQHWDDMLIYIITTKLDTITNKAWEANLDRKQIPTLKDMTEFLSLRCQILDAVSKTNKLQFPANQNKSYVKVTTMHSATSDISCPICRAPHSIYKCDKFLQSSTDQRFQSIKNKNLCINCLRPGHMSNKCNSSSCRKCSIRHNTLLHRDNQMISNASPRNHSESNSSSTNPAINPTSIVTHCGTVKNKSEVLLATAIIIVYDSRGQPHHCRAGLDSYSQSSYVTEELVRRLKLSTTFSPVQITGVNLSQSYTKANTTIKIKSRFNAFNSTLECVILKRITENLPLVSFDESGMNIPKNIKLADPDFNVSSQIDVLIGAELFWELLCLGKINTGKNMPILRKTLFGWIVTGKTQACNIISNNKSICNLTTTQLDNHITKFWNQKEYSPQQVFTKDEKECETIYSNTYRRNEEGRFIVHLPIKHEVLQNIRDTFELARKRFYSLERNLRKQLDKKSQYASFIQEYLTLGHMKESAKSTENQISVYLPHHGVVKQNSSTTKLRVVFDASAKSSTGISLNDALMVGPTLQEDLISIILRFRTHRFAITADVTKMYLADTFW